MGHNTHMLPYCRKTAPIQRGMNEISAPSFKPIELKIVLLKTRTQYTITVPSPNSADQSYSTVTLAADWQAMVVVLVLSPSGVANESF